MNKSPWESIGWSKTRYFQFIRSALRKAWTRYPANYEALKPYTRYVDTLQKNGKTKKKREILCVMCNTWHSASNIQSDHIEQAGTLKEYSDLHIFVQGLFCGIEDIQPLCKECHSIKTLSERKGLTIEETKTIIPLIQFRKEKATVQKEILKKLLTDNQKSDMIIPTNKEGREQMFKTLTGIKHD